jgi:LAS superfamily LD-carboxypeptidase LdcB
MTRTVPRCLAIAAVVAACLYYALDTSGASPPALRAVASASPAPAKSAKGLDPALRRALTRATAAARRDGIEIRITSGRRSAAYQQQLLDEAIVTYGSERIARQYVNTPELSTHVKGLAVDIGPTDAAYWMIQHGAEFGLCQIYANEVWHFERVTSPGGTCPPLKANAAGG